MSEPRDPMRDPVPMGWGMPMLLVAFLAAGTVPGVLAAQGAGLSRTGSSIEARVWLDRGVDAVLQPGERARVYYRSSHDAYVALFQVDTDGVVSLLFPTHPDERNRVRGGRDYRLLFADAPDWLVHDAPGVGYFFLLASRNPLDFDRLSQFPQTGEWNLALTGARIRQDPFVAIDGIAGLLLQGEATRTFALDFTGYHVGQSYSYPRFLCYECHVPQSYEAWNPYQQSCPQARVVIYNDPYFYPASRYQGNRIIFPRPPVPGQPQFVVRDRSSGEPGTPLVQGRPTAETRASVPLVGSGISGEGETVRRLMDVGVVNPAVEVQGMPEAGAPLIGDQVSPPTTPGTRPRPADREDRPVLQRRTVGSGDPIP